MNPVSGIPNRVRVAQGFSPVRAVLAFCISLLLLTTAATAQDRVYVFGGWMQVSRDQAMTAQSPEPGRSWIPSVAGGVGFWTVPHVGVEGTILILFGASVFRRDRQVSTAD